MSRKESENKEEKKAPWRISDRVWAGISKDDTEGQKRYVELGESEPHYFSNEKNRTRMRNSLRAKTALEQDDIESYMLHREEAQLGDKGQHTTRKTGSKAYADRAKRISQQTRTIAEEAKSYADMAIATAGSLHSSIKEKEQNSSSSSSSSYGLDLMKIVRNDREEKAASEAEVEVDLPLLIFDSDGIAGNMNMKPVRSNDDSFQKTYNDTIVPESYIQQFALESEEYKGVDPHNISQADRDFIDDQRAIEYKDDIQKIYDKVEESEILSGGNKDSLFSASDLNLEGQGDSLYPDDKHFMSAYERGQNAHAIKEVDLDNFDFSDFSRDEGEDKDDLSLFRGGEGIMSSIKALTELSADNGGSWFSEDKSMADYITPEQRISSINKARFDNDICEKLGKYNGRGAGSNNKMLLATGASLSTLNEMRKGDEGKSDFKQPSRSYKGNAVKLVRNSMRKGILMEQQYDP